MSMDTLFFTLATKSQDLPNTLNAPLDGFQGSVPRTLKGTLGKGNPRKVSQCRALVIRTNGEAVNRLRWIACDLPSCKNLLLSLSLCRCLCLCLDASCFACFSAFIQFATYFLNLSTLPETRLLIVPAIGEDRTKPY